MNHEFPERIKRNVIKDVITAIATLIGCVTVCIFYGFVLSVPLLALSVFALIKAVYTVYYVKRNGYTVLTGNCVNTDYFLFKRNKSVYLECGDKLVRIFLRHSFGAKAGATIRVYLKPEAKVYEKEGMYIISEYIAIETV